MGIFQSAVNLQAGRMSYFGFMFLSVVVSILAKLFVLSYILLHAPQNRPINTLVVIDQVRI